jgi:hypothetical protein
MRITSMALLTLAFIGCGSSAARDEGGAPDLGSGSGDDMTPSGDGDQGQSGQCPSPVTPDPLVGARLGCSFTAGALARDTVGLSDAARAQLPIKHIVVMMKENRSFDQIFGGLKALQPDVELFPPTF